MSTEVMHFGDSSIEINITDNVMHLKTIGHYTDAIALKMLAHLSEIIDQRQGDLIRVWDSTSLSVDEFQLTSQGIKKLAAWSQIIKKKWPNTKAYFIVNEGLMFGITRMYGMRADTGDDPMPGVIIVKSANELPPEIQSKIPN